MSADSLTSPLHSYPDLVGSGVESPWARNTENRVPNRIYREPNQIYRNRKIRFRVSRNQIYRGKYRNRTEFTEFTGFPEFTRNVMSLSVVILLIVLL
jgi:hypothetical protein